MTILEIIPFPWKVFRDKGPVNIPYAQRRYYVVAKIVIPHLTLREINELLVARSLALVDKSGIVFVNKLKEEL